MTRRLCAAILTFEVIAFGLSAPVLISIGGVSVATGLSIGLGLAVACLLVAGLLRFEWAYYLGWAVQVAAVAVGTVVASMYVVGGVFLALWATAFFLGRKIERERAEWERTGNYPGAPRRPASGTEA